MSERLSNDLLCQLVDGQKDQAETLARIEGNLTARVESLESTHKWNKVITYVVTPFLVLGSAVARHFGIKI